MSRIIGIDLGTTNSVAAYIDQGEPKVIINEEGGRITPSVVGFSKGDRFVGEVAKRQMLMAPEQTIHSVKRLMGKRFEDIAEEASQVGYDVVDQDGRASVQVGDDVFSPPQIAAFVLSKIKKSAEDFLGEAISEVVLTVPAYFTDGQRQATRDAGKIAGLEVVRIINEPTAAALTYMMSRKQAATIAVYDFGGGTFDISILDVDDDVAEVRATAGNNRLGGNDITLRVVDWLSTEFRKSNGIDVTGDRAVRQRLMDAAEKAKMDLSTVMETEIHLPFLTADNTGPKHLQTVLTRATFEFLVQDLLDQTVEQCNQALSEAKIKPSGVDEIILVGGSSRIPRVQEMVRELFGKPLSKAFNPDEVVAMGAAVQAGMLGGTVQNVTLLDVTNFSLGIEIEGRKFAKLIPKGSTVPVVRNQMVSTVTDNQSSVKIHVLQGENDMVRDNTSLGEFELTNIEPARRGVPRIEVTFTIDTDGIVNVAARDVRTGSEQGITIHSPSGMSSQQIDSARDAVQRFDSQDQDDKETADLRTKVEKQLFSIEDFLRAHRPELKKREIFDTEQALKRGRMALVKRADKRSLRDLAKYLKNHKAQMRHWVRSGDNDRGVSLGLD